MKILIDARMVKGHHGIGRHVKALVPPLSERGHEVSILSQSPETEAVFSGTKIKDVIRCRFPFAHPLEAFELTHRTRNLNYDVFHFPSFAVPLRPPPRTVVTIHDLIHLYRSTPQHWVYYHSVLRSALHQAARVITVSDWTRSDLVAKLGVPADKVVTVRTGLEDQFFRGPAPSKSSDSDKPYFVCLSNLKWHKNLRTLVDAAKKLWDLGHQFELHVSLGGDELPRKWKGLSNLRLIKNAPDEKILELLRNCTALVSPSILEGFNYPVAEALSQCRPVILSRGSAHSEFSGSLVKFYGEPEDVSGLTSALEAALNQKSPTKFDHNVLTQKAMIDKTLEVYQSVAL